MGPVKIALLGAGELHLPLPERAEAKCNFPNSITMTLYCASDEYGEEVKAVSTGAIAGARARLRVSSMAGRRFIGFGEMIASRR